MPTIQQLLDYLRRNNHINRQNPITARRIAQNFNISDGGAEVPIRGIIRRAIDQGELIGSSNRGFFIITELAELNRYLNSLQHRSELILRRRRNLLTNWNNQAGQNNTSNLTDLTVEEV